MSSREWKLLMKSPVGCVLTGIAFFGLAVWATCFNIYHASGGEIHSLEELQSYMTVDEVLFLIIGTITLVFFLFAARNATKRRNHDEEEMSEYEEEALELVEASEAKPIERKASIHTLSMEGDTVTFQVPACYEEMVDEEEEEIDPSELERFVVKTFWTEDVDMLEIYLHMPHREKYMNAEEYIRCCLTENEDVKEKDRIVEHTMIYGKLCYYYNVRYKNHIGKFQDMYIACDVGAGKIFSVELECVSWKKELNLNDVEGFFEFI